MSTILGHLVDLGACVGGLEAHGDPFGAMKDVQERERAHFTSPKALTRRKPSIFTLIWGRFWSAFGVHFHQKHVGKQCLRKRH